MKFPTFEEVDKGYCVYTDYVYLGNDAHGEPKYGEKKDLEVVIAHNNYKEIINGVYITRNRKHEKTGFRFVIAGNKYGYRYNYSEKGWADCVTKIKSILLFYRRCINTILAENK